LGAEYFSRAGEHIHTPFITDDPESGKLEEDTVLDITHESLIRNWEYLEQWAKEEFDDYSISLDFEKQLKTDGWRVIGQRAFAFHWATNLFRILVQ
jgi:hypothetical protein